MDGLAHFRRQQGLPALSINWGPWSEIGMAAKLTARHRSSGMIPLSPEDGMNAFEIALKQSQNQLMIAPMNWKQFQHTYERELPWLDDLLPSASKKEEPPTLLSKLKKAISRERETIMRHHLRLLLHTILGLRSHQTLTDTQRFFDSGMDSLMAVELRNRLQKDLGQKQALPVTLAFDYPSIDTLTKFLVQLLFGQEIKKEEAVPEKEHEENKIKEQINKMDLDEIYKLIKDKHD